MPVYCRFPSQTFAESDNFHFRSVDDIQDDAQSRRGQPVAHKIYGVPQTINTANYVYFQAFEKLAILESEQTIGSGESQIGRRSISSIVTCKLQ